MPDTLYIIGNGFDLHHGLRTSYANFRDDYVKRKCHLLWNDLLNIYGDTPQKDDLWWKDFENMLGKLDYENLSKSRNGEVLGFIKVRNLMKGKLPPLFGKWIKEIDNQTDVSKIGLIDELDDDALFFTFNYTLLLEKAYLVNDANVWHIHESIKAPDYIIVGHDANAGQLVKYVQEYNKDQQRISPYYADFINQEVLKGAKKVRNRIRLQEDLFYKYCDIKHYFAMGFSFNDIDMPYIEKIWSVNRNKKDTDWTLYWYSEGEDKCMKNKLTELGVIEGSIKTIKWV